MCEAREAAGVGEGAVVSSTQVRQGGYMCGRRSRSKEHVAYVGEEVGRRNMPHVWTV
jgi:hypothetical protein